MISEIRSLLPLTQEQAVLTCAVLCGVLFPVAGLTSPDNPFHPFMILATYFLLYAATRVITDDFASTKNPAQMRRGIFGPLQLLTGLGIGASISMSGDILGLLWLPVCFILGWLGTKNIAEVIYVWAWSDESSGCQHGKAASGDILEQMELAKKTRKNEEALMEDLTAFLANPYK